MADGVAKGNPAALGNQYMGWGMNTKNQSSKVKQSLEAKNHDVAGTTPQTSQPADATHRKTSVKESAHKAYKGY